MRSPGKVLTCLLLAGLASSAGCGSAGRSDPSLEDVSTSAATVVHRSVGGGHVATEATTVGSPERLAAYLRPLSPDLRRAVRAAARTVSATGPGVLVAQVVAVGCDPVVRARVVATGDSVRIEPVAPASPHPECLAPVTSVAVGLAPAYQ